MKNNEMISKKQNGELKQAVTFFVEPEYIESMAKEHGYNINDVNNLNKVMFNMYNDPNGYYDINASIARNSLLHTSTAFTSFAMQNKMNLSEEDRYTTSNAISEALQMNIDSIIHAMSYRIQTYIANNLYTIIENTNDYLEFVCKDILNISDSESDKTLAADLRAGLSDSGNFIRNFFINEYKGKARTIPLLDSISGRIRNMVGLYANTDSHFFDDEDKTSKRGEYVELNRISDARLITLDTISKSIVPVIVNEVIMKINFILLNAYRDYIYSLNIRVGTLLSPKANPNYIFNHIQDFLVDQISEFGNLLDAEFCRMINLLPDLNLALFSDDNLFNNKRLYDIDTCGRRYYSCGGDSLFGSDNNNHEYDVVDEEEF